MVTGQTPGKLFEQMTGWPSPDKVMSELQRLNNNMEMIQPDLHRLAASLDGLHADEIRNLTAALNRINVGDILRTLNLTNQLMSDLYTKLWGKK